MNLDAIAIQTLRARMIDDLCQFLARHLDDVRLSWPRRHRYHARGPIASDEIESERSAGIVKLNADKEMGRRLGVDERRPREPRRSLPAVASDTSTVSNSEHVRYTTTATSGTGTAIVTTDELLPAALSGDRDALTELLTRCTPAIRAALAGRITDPLRSSLDVDDIVQVTHLEAFLRLSRARPNSIAMFASWLKTMAEHNLVDAIKGLSRKKRPDPRKRAEDPQSTSYELVDELFSDAPTASRLAIRKEAAELMKTAMKCLPSNYRQVLELYELQGLPVETVAEALGKSQGAIYMLRARALDALRELMPPASDILSRST